MRVVCVYVCGPSICVALSVLPPFSRPARTPAAASATTAVFRARADRGSGVFVNVNLTQHPTHTFVYSPPFRFCRSLVGFYSSETERRKERRADGRTGWLAVYYTRVCVTAKATHQRPGWPPFSFPFRPLLPSSPSNLITGATRPHPPCPVTKTTRSEKKKN